MALPPLLRVPGPDPFSAGMAVGYGQMAIGEKVAYEVTRDAQGVLVTVTRTTANGIISGSARVAGTTSTRPSSSVTFGRIPTSRPPDEEPPPDPPPDILVPPDNWHAFAGAFTVGGSDITTTSDGSQTYVTMNSDDGYMTAGAVGRVYTGSVQVKGTGSSIGKTAYLIWRERRSDGSALSNDGAAVSVVLTGSYQTITSTYTATELGSAMDLRVTLRNVVSGEAFIVPTVPTFSYQDPVSSPPIADFVFIPQNPTTNQSPNAHDQATVQGATIVSCDWDLDNNGVYDIVGTTPNNYVASDAWQSAGTYTVKLRVTDSLGRQATTTKTLTVTSGVPANFPPTASFTFSPANPVAADTVTFTDTSSDSDGTIASRAWDLDNDGAYDDSTSATPTKVFGAAGTYTVGLQVTDDDGATGATSRTVVVADTVPAPTGSAFTRPYYPSALINSRIDSLAVKTSISAAAVTRLTQCVSSGKIQTAIKGESPSIYVSNHATQNLYSTPYGNWYLPGTAVNGGGSDHPLVIRDANHPTYGPYSEIRIWKADINHTNRTITGSGSGVFHFNNDGVRYGGVHSVGRPYTGSGPGNGLNYTAGIILASDVIAGEIAHAMRFAYGPVAGGPGSASAPTTGSFIPPAIKSDQGGTLSGAVPMGTRFRLKSTVDVNTRTVPGKANDSKETLFLRMFCLAAQRYGIMVSDGTGSGPNFYFESYLSNPAGWQQAIGVPDSTYGYAWILRDNTVSDAYSGSRTAFSGVPWGQFEVVVDQTENL